MKKIILKRVIPFFVMLLVFFINTPLAFAETGFTIWNDQIEFWPNGIAVDSEGNVYIVDSNNYHIKKFDKNGTLINTWGEEGIGYGKFKQPFDIAVDSAGNVYVVDRLNHQIQKFTSTGVWLASWGTYGTGDGQFSYPIGIALDSSGSVYVTDTGNDRIQKFDSNGVLITTWGVNGSLYNNFSCPNDIAVDSSGDFYVTDGGIKNQIQKFNSNGGLITTWGSGELSEPSRIAVDSENNVYVVDRNNQRIQKYNSNGVLIASWGTYGTGVGQFSYPNGIAVDSSGSVYVADGNNRIQVYTVDTTPPTVGGVSHNGKYNVDVAGTFMEGTATLAKDGGSAAPYLSGETISAEGSYVLLVTDEAGNSTTVNFTIDKTAPIVGVVSDGGLYNVTVSPTFNEGTATLAKDGGALAGYNSGTVITAEGSYILVATDGAGNSTTVSFTIDKTGPTVGGVSDNGKYNVDVAGTFMEGTATLAKDGGSAAPYLSGETISAEGSYVLLVTDAAGNSTTVSFFIIQNNAIATVEADTLAPTVGANNQITFKVKNTLEETDTNFDGDKNVTITGVEAAPDGTYGSFNETTLDERSAGAGQTIFVTFTDGVATANLKLNKADGQTIGFSIATVTTPASNALTITPTHGTAAVMAVTQDITAPASNGGQFAQQPKITIKDTYGNICTSDNATVVTAAREDAGAWTLTGTTTATASSGVVTFTNLGATNTALVNNTQIGFTSLEMTKVTSTAVALPAPSVTSSGGGSSSAIPVQTTIVIVNGVQQDAGKETISTEKGQSIVTVVVNNNVIESKIDEAVKNNKTGIDNIIQVPITDTKSEVAKVELTGDIVKKLEENTFDVSVKRDNVEYIIPAKDFTISNLANQMGVSKESLQNIKIEVQITKLEASVLAKYNGIANANGAELVFTPVSFEVVAKTTKADGTTQEIEISRFSDYVERVMEIPAEVNPSKITTGIVFNLDGTYSHVPTEVFQKDGKWYARLNSMTNSTYSVIWNQITVKSVENHWAKDVVNDMASRLVVFNAEAFTPDKAITRADFAEYIVRALGLYREGSKYENKFKDVSANGDRTLAILIANEYGIVVGYPDGTFRPDTLITREEAMTMYQKAMMVTKLVGTDPNRYQSYTDYKQVSSWATSYVKEVLSAHVFNGNTANTISPKSNLTYAEAAQAIKNLLVESKLINK